MRPGDGANLWTVKWAPISSRELAGDLQGCPLRVLPLLPHPRDRDILTLPPLTPDGDCRDAFPHSAN